MRINVRTRRSCVMPDLDSEWCASLEQHLRGLFHLTPTSASWINAVEGFFSALSRRRMQRGVLQSVADLKQAIASCAGTIENGGPREISKERPGHPLVYDLLRHELWSRLGALG
jgi:hypothetical protein